MKERPILFSAPMVRAILAGTKTQTRRAVRKQFAADAMVAEVGATTPEGWQVSGHSGLWWDDAGACLDDAVRCPYGMPGDRLWVREAWARDDEDGQLIYRADVGHDINADMWEQGRHEGAPRYRWRPSIHMPRVACRITLEITAVRVERLHDISEVDAAAEGAPLALEIDGGFERHPMGTHREGFGLIWQQINGRESWLANPWDWVVEFRKLQNNKAMRHAAKDER
jgi:hypothetical protein